MGRESYCDIRSQSHYVKLSGTYRQTLLAFESGSIKLAVPQLDGEDIPYVNKGTKILLLPYSLYKLPWIRYRCVVDDIEMYVDISYVSILGDESIDNASSALEVLKILDPDGTNPENYKKSDIYARVYEEEIQLSDNKVKALIYEKNDDSRICVDVYYDGMYIIFDFENELPSEEFFKKFGIRYAS